MSRLRLITLFLTFLIIFTHTAFAGNDRLHDRVNSIKLIQKAYKNQEINYRTALNYKIYSLFNKNMLPKAYISEAPIKSATPIILEARENSDLLYKENEFILQRPTGPTEPNESEEPIPGHYYWNEIAVWTYDSPGGHFKIHYTEDDAQGDAVYGYDGLQDTVPDYVTKLADYLDTAWSRVINDLGYTEPPSDGGTGGDGRLDVYLLDMNAYGYTAYFPNTSNTSNTSNTYIVIENDFAGFPENLDPEGDRTGSMKVTAAHEFFHTSIFQYTTNLFSNGWWSEATATWMEDIVYPEVKDYLNYLDIWFDHPEYSLDSTTGTHAYGTAIWAKYLSGKYENSIIKSTWERIEDDEKALNAISDEIVSQGTTLSELFSSFQEANYIRDYPDGEYYPHLKHAASYSASESDISLSGSLEHLSSILYLVNAAAETSSLTITFSNMHSGSLAVKLVLTTNTGEYEVRDIKMDSYSVTSQINNLGTSSSYSKVSVIIINTSRFLDADYSVSLNNAGGSGSSNCFIATAAYGSYLDPHVSVLRKFRDRYLLTNPASSALVDIYYKYSPPLAEIISEQETLRAVTRWCLTPLIYVLQYPWTGILIICISIFSFKKFIFSSFRY